MRAVWGEQTYNIEATLNQWGRARELHVMCREVNPDGA
jgi:hypothetical protein